jgi:uncharacterized protein
MAYWLTIIAIYVVIENAGYAALQVWLLRRLNLKSRWLEFAVYGWVIAMVLLFILDVREPLAWKPFIRDWLYLPLTVQIVWNMLILQLMLPIVLLAILVMRLRRGRQPHPEPAPEPAPSEGLSRRQFIYLVSASALPTTALAMGVHGESSRFDLRLREFDIPIRNLPPELEGFTIAHVSDLHSGIFVGPKRLKVMSDATNDLKADLIAVTGDIINREIHELPDAITALQRLESKFGIYLCEGNHDLIAGPGVVPRACTANNLPMIYNSCTTVPIRRQRLVLGGVSWDTIYYYEQKPHLVCQLFPERQAGDVRILLAHHPHLFDIAGSADLVLSGHTHGGQIMVGDVGLGRLRFKYCSGRFQRKDTTLIVSNGCGDWFPCRIGAPAEIGLLRLTAAKDNAITT